MTEPDAILSRFDAACTAEDPVLHAVNALAAFCRFANSNRSLLPCADAQTASPILFGLTSTIVDPVADDVDFEQVALGMGCVNALLTAPQDEFSGERLLHALALVTALRGHLVKRQLRHSGDRLMGAIMRNRAFEAQHHSNFLQ